MFNAEKSGVKLLAETLEPDSISEMFSWVVWGVCGVEGVGGRLPLILVERGVWIGVANLSSLGASPVDVLRGVPRTGVEDCPDSSFCSNFASLSLEFLLNILTILSSNLIEYIEVI